jgi:hypothetical protein
LDFEALLLSLRSNDPQTCLWLDRNRIVCPNYAKVPGYARPLGEALLGNTMVSTLYVDLSKLLLLPSDHSNNLPSEALAYIEPLLEFVSTSAALLDVKIVDGDDDNNDNSVPLDTTSWHHQLSGAVLTAIGNSSSVRELMHRGRL